MYIEDKIKNQMVLNSLAAIGLVPVQVSELVPCTEGATSEQICSAMAHRRLMPVTPDCVPEPGSMSEENRRLYLAAVEIFGFTTDLHYGSFVADRHWDPHTALLLRRPSVIA